MKILKASVVMALAVAGGAGVAYADTGTFVRGSCSLVFYYGISAGNAESNNCSGARTVKLCADAPGATATNTFAAELWQNRTAQPDIRRSWTPQLAYRAAAHCQAPVSLVNASHHVTVGWSYASGAGPNANGYGRTQTP
jgi:hypothetical protein